MLLTEPDNPQNLPLPVDPIYYNIGFLGPKESATKPHLHRFSHFCRAHKRKQQTDRQFTLLRLWQQAASVQCVRCGRKDSQKIQFVSRYDNGSED